MSGHLKILKLSTEKIFHGLPNIYVKKIHNIIKKCFFFSFLNKWDML